MPAPKIIRLHGARGGSVIKPKDLPRLDEWKPAISSPGYFTPEECDKVIAYCGEMVSGHVEGEDEEQSNRQCKVAWINLGTPGANWIFDKTSFLVKEANAKFYRTDLFGFTEKLQITRYEAGNFQNWHMDLGHGRYSVRKLTFSIQLSAPEDYEGGEFEVLAYYDPMSFPKVRGTMIVMPTYVVHRVKPVTSGIRYSLIGWIGGPHFR